MAFKGSVEDRLAIRERVDAYCDAVFRRNADDWIACWGRGRGVEAARHGGFGP